MHMRDLAWGTGSGSGSGEMVSARHLTVRSGYVAALLFVPLSVAVICSFAGN